jgi:hypothetical protein
MKPSARAQQNHNELFPGHVSTLAVTDPELIEIFDNFAFDEVLAYGTLELSIAAKKSPKVPLKKSPGRGNLR